MPECAWAVGSGRVEWKMAPSLSLVSCQLPVSVKENPDRKKNIAIQMTPEYVPAQRCKRSTKWTAKAANINKYLLMLQNKELLWKNVLANTFLCHKRNFWWVFFFRILDMFKQGSSRQDIFGKFIRHPKRILK